MMPLSLDCFFFFLVFFCVLVFATVDSSRDGFVSCRTIKIQLFFRGRVVFVFGFLRLCITGETTTLRGSSTDTAFLPLLLFSGGKRKVLTKKNVLGDDGLCSETTPVGGGPSTQTSPNDGLGIYGH